ncbi:MAG: formate dehydrogenase, partial [Aromatoleum sp.]|nr:formate dehydrogenase [Aromatoleum sp.]
VASLPAAAGVVAPVVQPVVAGPGYRETTHVRDYYRTCKL